MTNNKIRRIIFLLFVATWLILAGLILPYAFGYKLNPAGWRLQRTGIFDIKTTPNGAVIYLNGKKQTKFLSLSNNQEALIKTPVKIKNLIPGTYDLRLEINGYWPWQKQLTIQPGETTYLEDVYFFKENQPQLIIATPLGPTAASPDNKYLAIVTNDNLQIWSWDKSKIIQEIKLPAKFSDLLLWSPSGQKISYGTLIIDWKAATITDLGTIGIKTVKQLAWLDDNQFYFQEKDEIKSLNLKNNSLTTTDFKKNIQAFTVKNGYLYVVSGSDEPLLTISKNGGESSGAIKLRASDRYRFLNTNSDNIQLQEINSKKSYLIETKFPWSKDYFLEEIGVLSIGCWATKSKLIFSNEFELSLWTKESKNKLLTRVSQPITAIAWHKSNNYIVFSTTGSLHTLELDDRNNYNILNLWTGGQIDQAFFNREGTAVFFWSSINGQDGFYLLQI